MVDEFSDALAVGGDRKMYVFFTRQARDPVCYKVPLVRSLFCFLEDGRQALLLERQRPEVPSN